MYFSTCILKYTDDFLKKRNYPPNIVPKINKQIKEHFLIRVMHQVK